MQDLPTLELDRSQRLNDGFVDGRRALAGPGDDKRIEGRVQSESRGRSLTGRQLEQAVSNWAAGDLQLVHLVWRDVLARRLKLAADGRDVTHQVLVCLSGNDVGI